MKTTTTNGDASEKLRVALYARVSTDKQELTAQWSELRGFCAGRGYVVATEQSDQMSGGKRGGRLGLAEVMRLAKDGQIDAVVVTKIDRVARSVLDFAQIVAELDKAGVALMATSQGIDTSKNNPAGRMQMQLLAIFAEFERNIISERVKAGIAHAKANGATFGHPSKVLPSAEECRRIVVEWRERTGGVGLRELRKLLGNPSLDTTAKLACRYSVSAPAPA